MAYTRPPVKNTGDTFDLTAYNAIRDSLIAGVDQVTTKGDLLVATAADAVARLGVGAGGAELVPNSGAPTGLAWQIRPICSVQNSGQQDPNTSQWHTLTWDTDLIDTNSMHSTSSNTDRITVPANGAGVYRVGCNIGFVTSGLTGESGHYGVQMLLNGSTMVGKVFDEAEMNGQELWMNLDMPTGPSVGNYYIVQVWTSRDINISADSKFYLHWLRPSP